VSSGSWLVGRGRRAVNGVMVGVSIPGLNLTQAFVRPPLGVNVVQVRTYEAARSGI
jgi:hypothetical protein